MLLSSSIILAIAHLIPISSGQITCYRPNGDKSVHNDTLICNSLDGADSMCCNVNDDCLPNGICKVPATAGDPDSTPTYWRDTCSSSEWPDVGCLKVCATDGLESENTPMTPCDGTDTSSTWCCGSTTDCCGTGDEVNVPRDIYKEVSSTTATSSTSTSTSTSMQTAVSPGKRPSEESSELSSGAKAGIGVGVAAGVCAIIAVVIFFLRRRRRNEPAVEQSYHAPAPKAPAWLPPQEMEARSQVHEKPADERAFTPELDGQPSTANRH